MEFYLSGTKIRVEYSFILMLSFAVLLGAKDLVYLLLFSICHEIGHLSVLLMCRGRADSLVFSFYGLALRYSCTLSRLKEFAVILAGPLVNLICYLFFKDDINLVLFALNMLPIFPLDGGRLLRLYSMRISRIISVVFLTVLIFLSVILVVYYKSFSLVLISIYLLIYSINY